MYVYRYIYILRPVYSARCDLLHKLNIFYFLLRKRGLPIFPPCDIPNFAAKLFFTYIYRYYPIIPPCEKFAIFNFIICCIFFYCNHYEKILEIFYFIVTSLYIYIYIYIYIFIRVKPRPSKSSFFRYVTCSNWTPEYFHKIWDLKAGAEIEHMYVYTYTYIYTLRPNECAPVVNT